MATDIKYATILVPTDGSDYSFRAAEHAAYLAKSLGGSLVVLNVIDESSTFHSGIHYAKNMELLEESGKEAVGRIVALCELEGVPVRALFARGEPKSTILRVAEAEKVDCIVLGSIGMSAIERVLIGSVSESVVRHAKCPVLLVRGK